MKATVFTALSTTLFFFTCSLSSGQEWHRGRGAIERGGEWQYPRTYRESPYYYPAPYYHNPYSYYPYPSIPYQRYWDSRRSPYESLAVKPAGSISIVVQPLDTEVLVDGYKLTQKDDLTYEIGLLTGLHSVEAKRKNYKPYLKEVMVEGGRMILLTIELEKDN